MKKLKLLFLTLTAFALLNCSSSDDSNDTTTLPTENSFSLVIDGVTYTFTTFAAVKNYDNYEVLGSNSNEENFYLKFNAAGVIDRANFYSTDFSLDIYYNSAFNYPSYSFDLSNIVIDPTNNVVKANFSGLVYEDDISLTQGNSLIIEQGSFNLVYIDAQQAVDVFVDASVNGNAYQSVKYSSSSGFNGSDLELTGYADGEFNIGLIINPNTIQPGTYDFTNSDAANSVSVTLVNPYDDTYEEMGVNGTLVIEEVVAGSPSYFRGTFNVTATSSQGTTYNVTNGNYFMVY